MTDTKIKKPIRKLTLTRRPPAAVRLPKELDETLAPIPVKNALEPGAKQARFVP